MNRTYLATIFILALALLLGGTRAAHAAESYDNCTGFITSAPASITTQGTWCMKNDLTASFISGNAISINANNVTIDCNGFKIVANPGSGNASTGNGIYANNHLNITVRHCDIRGFQDGVLLTGATSGGHAIEDNRIDSNNTVGISVTGDGSVIRRNWVFNTGGSISSGPPMGIYANHAVDILDNTISIVTATGSQAAMGILSDANTGGSISGNRVRGVAGAGATPIDYGILPDGHVALRNNEVTGRGIANGFGIDCSDSNGRTKDNVINGFASGITTCSDDGGNVVAP